MKPRPLYRWKSFWLGILVFVFLGWGWVRSMTHLESLSWTGEGVSFGVINVSAKAEFYCERSSALKSSGLSFLQNEVSDRSPEWFPPSLQRNSYFLKRSKVQVAEVWVAHWLLILLFLVPWLAFLFWRVRRHRKQTESNA
jgi:hypothetical protein